MVRRGRWDESIGWGAGTPGEVDAFLRAEVAKWTRVVKEAGIRAE